MHLNFPDEARLAEERDRAGKILNDLMRVCADEYAMELAVLVISL
jgi:hypothetical protein